MILPKSIAHVMNGDTRSSDYSSYRVHLKKKNGESILDLFSYWYLVWNRGMGRDMESTT